MSDSKKDLTRIEDLGEYLHQLDEGTEDYLPDLPDESDSSSFMEETPIEDEDPFSSSDDSSDSYEGGLASFDSQDNFSSDSNFDSSFESSEDSFSFENEEEEEAQESDTPPEFNDSFQDSFSSSFEDTSEEEDPFLNESITEEEEKEEEAEEEITPTFIEEETPPVSIPLEEKTPLPPLEDNPPYKTPESFADVKSFAESSSFTGMAAEGNPSFSVLLKEIRFLEDAEDILSLIKELGLSSESDEVLMNRLSRGEFIIPRISEYAAILLTHKLRRFDIDILIGPSDEIQPPKHKEQSEVGLVSKLSLYQNQSHQFQFSDAHLDVSQVIISATPGLDGYQVLKYISVASEHKIIDGHLIEDENSEEVSSYYHELAQKLKAHAVKVNANAVIGLNYQLTPLPSQFSSSSTKYRLTCTGNLVWINKI